MSLVNVLRFISFAGWLTGTLLWMLCLKGCDDVDVEDWYKDQILNYDYYHSLVDVCAVGFLQVLACIFVPKSWFGSLFLSVVNLLVGCAKLVTAKDDTNDAALGVFVGFASMTCLLAGSVQAMGSSKGRKKKKKANSEKNKGSLEELHTYTALNDEESEEKEEDATPKKRHASMKRVVALAWPERYILGLATLALLVSAGAQMLIPVLFSDLINSLYNHKQFNVWYLVATFTLMSFFAFLRGSLFTLAGERLVARFRVRVFTSIIKQDIEFFDASSSGELQSRLSNDTTVIQNAVTTNVSMGLRWAAQVFVGLIIIFFISWKLSLLMLSVVPALAIGARAYGGFVRGLSKSYQDALGKAGECAEQAFSCIRTVRSFSQEVKEVGRYEKMVQESFLYGKKKSWAYGTFIGVVGFAAYLVIALVLWYGGKLCQRNELTPKQLNSFLLYTIYIAVALGGLSGLYSTLQSAVGASERMFSLIDKVPTISSSLGNDAGGPGIMVKDPKAFKGKIEFLDVKFTYPTRLDMPVLRGVSFKCEPGETVALVGSSGSGKSTIVSLLERFYDPVQGGVIKIDDVPLQKYDLPWLHTKISLVSQEPTLFATSIKDNIMYGGVGEDYESAAKQANAHDFINLFPQKYETNVGERGVQLSGGQKQRIAIARAVLGKPKILLLDEATSALDAESEHLVQEALERLMATRSTLVIAHRLSTVRNADNILVVSKGKIMERGKHRELVKKENGLYRALVEKQLD